jgi:predicted molibdopterin-dependent oxidoreductase YjgC
MIARAIQNGEVRALLMLNQIPELEWSDELVKAVPKLTFFGVMDLLDSPMFETAAVVVPAACWAEKDGTIMNRDGRIQRLRTLVAPPAGTRTDSSFLQELLVTLGTRKSVVSSEGIFREAFAGLTSPGLDYRAVGEQGTLLPSSPTSAGPAVQPANK